jgi:hypothetical protein
MPLWLSGSDAEVPFVGLPTNCAVLCDNRFTAGTPRFPLFTRDASIPLVWVAFAFGPPTGGSMK